MSAEGSPSADPAPAASGPVASQPFVPPPPRESAYVRGLKMQLPTVGIELVLIGVVAYLIGLNKYLVAGIIAAIVAGLLTPLRWQWVASLVGFLGLAALTYFYFHNNMISLILVIVGVAMAAMNLADKRVGRG
jgi:lipid-A-disaccharide synthase-like uncharacterized protein